MEYVYIVRHHFKNDNYVEKSHILDLSDEIESNQKDSIDDRKDENERNIENQFSVTEWVFKSFKSAFEHTVEISLSLMGIDRHNLQDLDEVRMFKELSLIFKEEQDKPYKAIRVPCDTGKEELEEDLIEFHKVQLLE